MAAPADARTVVGMALADLDLLVERRRDLRRVLHDLTGAIGA